MSKPVFYKKDMIYISEKGIPVIVTVENPRQYLQFESLDHVSLFALESEYRLGLFVADKFEENWEINKTASLITKMLKNNKQQTDIIIKGPALLYCDDKDLTNADWTIIKNKIKVLKNNDLKLPEMLSLLKDSFKDYEILDGSMNDYNGITKVNNKCKKNHKIICVINRNFLNEEYFNIVENKADNNIIKNGKIIYFLFHKSKYITVWKNYGSIDFLLRSIRNGLLDEYNCIICLNKPTLTDNFECFACPICAVAYCHNCIREYIKKYDTCAHCKADISQIFTTL